MPTFIVENYFGLFVPATAKSFSQAIGIDPVSCRIDSQSMRPIRFASSVSGSLH